MPAPEIEPSESLRSRREARRQELRHRRQTRGLIALVVVVVGVPEVGAVDERL